MDSLQNYEKPKEEVLQNDRPFLEMVSPVKTEKLGEKSQLKTVAPPPPPAKRKAPTVKEAKQEEEPTVEEG